MNRFLLYGIFLFFVILTSCSKEKDELKPQITITSPTSLQKIKAGDDLNILGLVKDDVKIEQVIVTLRNKNNLPILKTFSKTFSDASISSYDLNIIFSFSDSKMKSGEYDFNVTVSDGVNTTTKYITIKYEESEREKEGVFVLSNDGNFSKIYQLDNNNLGSFFKSISGDFIGAAIDVTNQQLLNVAQTVGDIGAISPINSSEIWSVSVPGNPPTPYYTGFYYYEESIFLGKRNGVVQGYDKNGNPNFSTFTNSGNYLESAFVHNDEYLLVEENSIIVSNTRNVSLYWLYSGVKIHQTPIPADVVGFFTLSSSSLVFLANLPNNQAELYFYQISSGAFTSPFTISFLGEIKACVEVENGVYLVAENNNLTLVNAHQFSILGYLPGVTADRIWYDELANELYVADDNVLTIYDYSLKTIKATYTHPEEIKEVLFWYNK